MLHIRSKDHLEDEVKGQTSNDMILIERVENVAATVEKLPRASAESDVATLVGSLSGEIDELERAWDRREDMLKGLE